MTTTTTELRGDVEQSTRPRGAPAAASQGSNASSRKEEEEVGAATRPAFRMRAARRMGCLVMVPSGRSESRLCASKVGRVREGKREEPPGEQDESYRALEAHREAREACSAREIRVQ